MSTSENEWNLLYHRLREFLGQRGKESPFGEGDFWVVDDDWGGQLQKVSIFHISFLTPSLVQSIQQLLRETYPGWGVMIQLELGGSTDLVPPEGMIVYCDRVEEAWDKEKLRGVLGNEFAW